MSARLRKQSAHSVPMAIIRSSSRALQVKPGLEPFDLGEKRALVAHGREAKHGWHQLTEGALPAGIRESLGSQHGLYRDGKRQQRYDESAFEHQARPAGLA